MKTPGTYPLSDALDDTALAGRIATLKDDDNLGTGLSHPELQLDEFALQFFQFLLVILSG